MTAVSTADRHRERWIALALFAVALACRLPAAVVPPTRVVYNTDELSFLDSLLGLVAGQIPNNLQWPAATVLFALLPLVVVHLLATSPAALSAALALDPYGFSSATALYLGETLYDPARLLVPARIVLAVATSLIAVVAYHLLHPVLGRLERTTTALVLATSPVLLAQTAVVKGDGVGALFWTASLAYLVRLASPAATVGLATAGAAGGWLGLAVASRLTHLAAFPALVVTTALRFRRRASKAPAPSAPAALETAPAAAAAIQMPSAALAIAAACAGVALPILVFLPFVWTAPFAFLKGALGNVVYLSRLGTGTQPLAAFTLGLASLAGPPASLLALIGAVALWRRRERRGVAALTLGVFLLFFLPLVRSGFVAERYALPLLPVVALWAGVGLAATVGAVTAVLGGVGARTRARTAVVAGGALLATVVGVNGATAAGWFRATHGPSPTMALAAWLTAHTAPGERLAVPARLAPYVPPNATALDRLLAAYRAQPASAAERLARLVGRGRPGRPEPVEVPDFLLDAWFGDEEALDRFRYQALRFAAGRGAAPPAARDVVYYQEGAAPPEKPDRVGRAEALTLLAAGEVDLLVADEAVPEFDGVRPLRAEIGGWRVYGRQAPPAASAAPAEGE